jgi:hypothetical protein
VAHPAVPLRSPMILEPVRVPDAGTDLLLAGGQQLCRLRTEQPACRGIWESLI